jgi:hypothetical protein
MLQLGLRTRSLGSLGDSVGSSYLRCGASVLLLSAGLFLGATGGATAVADTDSESGGSSADGDGAADGSSQDGSTASSPAGPTATDPTGSVTDTPSTTLVTSTFGSGATADPQPSSGEISAAEAGGTDTETTESDLVAGKPSSNEPGPTVVEPLTNIIDSGPTVVASVPSVVEPPPTVDPPAAAFPPPAAAVPPLVATVLPPVPGPATPVANVFAPVPVLIEQAFDVVAALEEMLTSVAGAVVSFTQPQADLFALLGFAGVDPALGGVGGHAGRGLSTASVLDPMVSPLQMVLPRSAFPAIPSAGDATEDAALAGITTMLASQESSLPAQAPPMPDGVIPVGVQEFFQQVVEEVKRSPGLAVLAAAALPGLGGLLVVTAAGIRLGYRQAKAGFALHAADIARFARSGPIGVVRSGSLIAARSRPLNVVRAGPLHAGCVLDEAA